MSESLTLGVVGHVDHGKTALVRALTGIETDRLKEERERGLSIVLGFSFLETPNGTVDLIDVPGHEDFIRAMISGATSLDGVILCVAANEGVMPQTVEHLNIASLLGVDRGFIVLTKTDLVDAEELELARDDIAEFVASTFLCNAPIIEASAHTGDGIDDVRRALTETAALPVQRTDGSRFFMPLDRVFTMRGFGLVVTGTLRNGQLCVDDRVEIMPAGRSATVRALQTHGQSVDSAKPGQRVAINLRNLDRHDVRRGDVVASPELLKPTRRLDVELRLLDDHPAPLKNGATVRLLTGTTEAIAKLRLLDSSTLEPGQTGFVQLRLDRDIATHPTERFVIRSYSPMQTIGGGQILEVNPTRHRRFDTDVTDRLETAATGDLDLIVAQRLRQAGAAGAKLNPVALGVDRAAFADAMSRLGAVAIGDYFVAPDQIEALEARILEALARFHEDQPFKHGLALGKLSSELGSDASPEVLRHVIATLVDRKVVSKDQEVLRLATFDPFASLSIAERRSLGDIERAYLSAGLEAPAAQAVVGSDRTKQTMYRLLLESGRLVRLRTYDRNSQAVVHADVLAEIGQAIRRQFPPPRQFALKDIRDLLGSTRRYVVPLMEHFDASGVTVRHGDYRQLRV